MNGTPKLQPLPQQVWINPPATAAGMRLDEWAKVTETGREIEFYSKQRGAEIIADIGL